MVPPARIEIATPPLTGEYFKTIGVPIVIKVPQLSGAPRVCCFHALLEVQELLCVPSEDLAGILWLH